MWQPGKTTKEKRASDRILKIRVCYKPKRRIEIKTGAGVHKDKRTKRTRTREAQRLKSCVDWNL